MGDCFTGMQLVSFIRGARRTVLCTSLAALIAAGCLVGTPRAEAETLRQALAAAYRYNPQIDAERARLRATDEEVARANSGYRPIITGTADIGARHTRVRPNIAGDSGTLHPRGYAVTLSQPIFTGFQTTNAVRSAEAGVRAGRESLRNVEQSVLLQAVTAYMDVVRDQAVVKLRENNVNVLSRELKASQDRFAVGEVTRTDVAQAEARRAGAVSDLELARANLKTSRATYERVIGHPPSNLKEPTVQERIMPKSLNEAISIGNRENPAIVAALYTEQQARYTVDQIRGELLPQVDLEASYQDRYGTSDAIDSVATTEVTGRVTVPIYEGGEVYARVRQAKHTHVSRLQEIEQSRTEVQEGVVSAWSNLNAARAQLKSDQSQVQANTTALQGVREEEKVGQRTLLDVLNAEQELLNSQVNLVTTRRNLVVSAYTLLTAIGRMDADQIDVASQVYDPEVHYDEVRRKWWGVNITHGDGRTEKVDAWHARVEREPIK
jgi:outer membrane protein